MKCSKAKRRLVRFVDGDLAPGEAERVRRHLESCERCRKDASLLRSTLALAVQRSQQGVPPAPAADIVSQFWRREQDERAKGSRGVRWHVVRGSSRTIGSVFRLRYAIGAVPAMLMVAFLILTLLQDGQPPSRPPRTSSSQIAEPPRPAALAVERLAEIEKELAELEAAVGNLRTPALKTASFTGQEMHEIYAAIELAAANNYRDILKMNDLAAKKYAQVASRYPETLAGQEARQIVSRLN